MFTKKKSNSALRNVAYVGIALIVTSCGMQPASELNAIKGKEVFRLVAKKSIIDSQVPSTFSPLEPIRQTIEQVTVTTNSEILGIEILPVANADRGQIDVVAKLKSNNIFEGPVNSGVIGKGATEGRAIKSIMFDDQGIKANPATFDGKTVVEVVTGGATPSSVPPIGSGGLIEGLKNIVGGVANTAATSQFGDRKAEIEAKVYKETSAAVGKHLNEKVDPIVTKYDGYYQEYFYKPFYASNRFPAYLNFSTTADSIVISGSSEKYGMALSDMSALTDNDVSFQINEAFLNAFFLRNIKTFKPMALEDFKKLLGSMPIDALNFAKLQDKAKMSGNLENVRLDFSHGMPVSVKIADNLLTFNVRAAYMYKVLTSDVKTPPADISVGYRMALSADGKLSLKRELINIKQLDGGSDSIWTIVKPIMEENFKELVEVPSMPIKKASGETLTLVPSHLSSAGGWLNLSWKLVK